MVGLPNIDTMIYQCPEICVGAVVDELMILIIEIDSEMDSDDVVDIDDTLYNYTKDDGKEDI